MRLYHGTNVDFDVIDITKSQKFKDFGQGFYLTDIYTQAEELAKKKARLFGGSPVVQVYEFDEVCLNTLTLTDFTLHFSCCFTNLLHSHFVSLLNNFTMQEKCY